MLISISPRDAIVALDAVKSQSFNLIQALPFRHRILGGLFQNHNSTPPLSSFSAGTPNPFVYPTVHRKRATHLPTTTSDPHKDYKQKKSP